MQQPTYYGCAAWSLWWFCDSQLSANHLCNVVDCCHSVDDSRVLNADWNCSLDAASDIPGPSASVVSPTFGHGPYVYSSMWFVGFLTKIKFPSPSFKTFPLWWKFRLFLMSLNSTFLSSALLLAVPASSLTTTHHSVSLSLRLYRPQPLGEVLEWWCWNRLALLEYCIKTKRSNLQKHCQWCMRWQSEIGSVSAVAGGSGDNSHVIPHCVIHRWTAGVILHFFMHKTCVEEEHYIFHCWCIHDVEYVVPQEESTDSAENVVTLADSLVVHENGHRYGEEELAVSGIECHTRVNYGFINHTGSLRKQQQKPVLWWQHFTVYLPCCDIALVTAFMNRFHQHFFLLFEVCKLILCNHINPFLPYKLWVVSRRLATNRDDHFAVSVPSAEHSVCNGTRKTLYAWALRGHKLHQLAWFSSAANPLWWEFVAWLTRHFHHFVH